MMNRRVFENNKRIFIKNYVEYYLATGRKPKGYDNNKNKYFSSKHITER